MLVHSAFNPFYFFLSYLFNRMLNIFWGVKEYPQKLPSAIYPFLSLEHTTCMFMTKCFDNLGNTSKIDEIREAVWMPCVLSVDLICTSATRTINNKPNKNMAWLRDGYHHLKTDIAPEASFQWNRVEGQILLIQSI